LAFRTRHIGLWSNCLGRNPGISSHGYPWLIHKLSYRFKGHDNLHVRSYKEKSNSNTPLELATLNEIARFHLVIDEIDQVPKLRTKFDFWHMEREQDR
jgi:phosphoketolase